MRGSNISSDLISRCAKGEHLAQMELYDSLFEPIYRSAYRVVGDRGVAEDIAQESFMKFFSVCASYENRAHSVEFSLRRIAINAAIDSLRRSHVEFVCLPFDVADECEAEPQIEHWQVERVKQVVQQLPAGLRVVLSLKVFEGLDFDEIGAYLHLSSSSVRSQFARARQRVITIMEQK